MSNEEERRPVVVPIRRARSADARTDSLIDQLHKMFADEGVREQSVAVSTIKLRIEGDGNVQIGRGYAVEQFIKGNNNIQIAGLGDLSAEVQDA